MKILIINYDWCIIPKRGLKTNLPDPFDTLYRANMGHDIGKEIHTARFFWLKTKAVSFNLNIHMGYFLILLLGIPNHCHFNLW